MYFVHLEKVNRFAVQLLCNDFLSPYLDLLRQADAQSVLDRWLSTSLLLVRAKDLILVGDINLRILHSESVDL